jgi:hypothetical protein
MFTKPLAPLLLALVLLPLGGTGLAQSSPLQVVNQNGQAKVIYQGRQVWAGPVQGAAAARSRSVNGKDYAAVFDGDKVLWENVPGAAKQVGAANDPAGFSLQRTLRRNRNAVDDNQRQLEEMLKDMDKDLEEAHPAKPATTSRSGGSSGGTAGGSATSRSTLTGNGQTFSLNAGPDGTVTRSNGVTTLTWKGKVIPLGRTTGPLSFKTRNINGTEAATLLEGDRVLWQSTTGPAQPGK